MVRDEKYIVFKRDDLGRCFQALLLEVDQSIVRDIESRQITDAVVLRKQDVFAPPALDAYANAILTVVEALKVTGSEPGLVPRLLKISDYFRAQAEDAYDMQRKLPD